jgi:hypothetical protein
VNIMRGVLAEQFPIEVYLSDWHDYHQRHPEPVGGTDIAALATRVIEKAAARPGEPIRAQHVRDIGEAVKSELVLTDAARERLDDELATHMGLARLTRNFEFGPATFFSAAFRASNTST